MRQVEILIYSLTVQIKHSKVVVGVAALHISGKGKIAFCFLGVVGSSVPSPKAISVIEGCNGISVTRPLKIHIGGGFIISVEKFDLAHGRCHTHPLAYDIFRHPFKRRNEMLATERALEHKLENVCNFKARIFAVMVDYQLFCLFVGHRAFSFK